MRRVLGVVLPALLLTGVLGGSLTACGDDDTGTVADDTSSTAPSSPGGDPTDEPTVRQGDEVDHQLVTVLTETAAGGDVSLDAVPLVDDAAVQEFVAPFTEPLQTSVQQAVQETTVPDDMRLYAAVVAVGCDAPDAVHVVTTGSGLQIVAEKVAAPKPECFAPMTSVALVLVPASAVE